MTSWRAEQFDLLPQSVAERWSGFASRSDREYFSDLVGIQVDEPHELEEITSRLKKAELGVHSEGETTCCYARSNKAWVSDPSGVPWETYQTMADAEVFSQKSEAVDSECCVPDESEPSESSCCG
jgi:hypothetical protein